MKKKKSFHKKPSRGSGLVIRKNNSYTHTIKFEGEPDAKVTIPYENIEGLKIESDWENHSLVKKHGCTVMGTEEAVKSLQIAMKKPGIVNQEK